MIPPMLPQTADNSYRGYRLALWLFGILVTMKSAIGLNAVFNGRVVASSADGIPLDSFGPAGAQAVVALFGIWGLSQVFICVLCAFALVRYRTLIPFMYAVLLVEHLSRRLFLTVMPIARVGTPPGPFVNILLLTLMVVGLVLSVLRRTSTAS
jgi:hypothetical protein